MQPAVGPGDARKVGRFSYDAQGRLVYLNWTCASARTKTLARDPYSCTSNLAPLRFRPPRRTRAERPEVDVSLFFGYEKYTYEDPAHPLHATYYESLDEDGFHAARYQWHMRGDGLITDVESSSFEDSVCADPCKGGAKCCKELGVNDTGACFAVDACSQLGGGTWHYEYDDHGRTLSVNASGAMAHYVYDDAGRILNTLQESGNATDPMYMAQYKEGHILSQIFFVVYPIFPEAWGFDAPTALPAHDSPMYV